MRSRLQEVRTAYCGDCPSNKRSCNLRDTRIVIVNYGKQRASRYVQTAVHNVFSAVGIHGEGV